jgi:Malic enzyme, N-terminal domain
MDEQLVRSALDYHRFPTPGKISILPTKGLTNQRDLALAYSPGVAAACTAIAENPLEASNLTSRANLVAVVTNGSAVLGLGNIGALAGKPRGAYSRNSPVLMSLTSRSTRAIPTSSSTSSRVSSPPLGGSISRTSKRPAAS